MRPPGSSSDRTSEPFTWPLRALELLLGETAGRDVLELAAEQPDHLLARAPASCRRTP